MLWDSAGGLPEPRVSAVPPARLGTEDFSARATHLSHGSLALTVAQRWVRAAPVSLSPDSRVSRQVRAAPDPAPGPSD